MQHRSSGNSRNPERDRKMARMRKRGFTLEAIGEEFGLTKERVRQVLSEYHPEAKTTMIARTNLAMALSCSPGKIVRLESQGVIKPRRRGRFLYYDEGQVEKAREALEVHCAGCGQLISPNRRRFCQTCGEARKRYPYPFLTEDQKKRHNLATSNWKKKNRKQLKERQGTGVNA